MTRSILLAFTIIVILGGVATAASLSGSWTTSAAIALQTFSFSSFSSTLTVDYNVGGWTFRSLTQIGLTGWTSQVFSATGVIGGLSMTTHLAFDPTHAAFSYWNTASSLTLAGVAFTATSNLTSTGIGWTFRASGSIDGVDLSSKAYFNETASGVVQTGSYGFCFSQVDINAKFPFGCINPVSLTLSFSATDGFNGLTIDMNNITWDQFPAVTFDVTVEFSLQTEGKTLTITPKLNLKPGCITLYGELVTTSTPLVITGLNIYGISFTYSWDQGSIASYSSFASDKNATITGKSAYWEKFTLKTTTDSCCGGGITTEASTYFQTGSSALFDWGETDISLAIGIGSNLTLKTGMAFTAATGFEEWDVGAVFTW